MTEFSHCCPTDRTANASLLLEYLQLLASVMKSSTEAFKGVNGECVTEEIREFLKGKSKMRYTRKIESTRTFTSANGVTLTKGVKYSKWLNAYK